MRTVAVLVVLTSSFFFLGASERCMQAQETNHQSDQNPSDYDGVEIGQMTSDELLDAYDDVLLKSRSWSSGKMIEEIESEIANRDDPRIDERLRILAEKVIRADGELGYLGIARFHSKIAPTRTVEILFLIGRRRTVSSVDYLLSQVESEYAVVRAWVSRGLRSFDLITPDNSAAMAIWAPLLWDRDIEVAYVSLRTLKSQLTRASSISGEVVRAVVRAQKEMRPRVQQHPEDYDFQDIDLTLDDIVSDCKRILNDRLAKATGREKETAERLLHLLNEPDAALPAGNTPSGEGEGRGDDE